MKNKPTLPAALALAGEYAMFPQGSTVLLAASGGRDSMALLHWMGQNAGRWGVSLAVGHYHHGMRGPAADRDLDRVKAWCARENIPFYSGRGAVYDEARRRNLGVEETGRTLRYAFLEGLADEIGAAAIATAHNADDNAETLLLHLLRGTGLQGLTGIPPRRGRLVRPLLTTTRAAIDDYVAAWAIPYGDDCTNADDAYARNRLRHQVTPVLQSLNPRYVECVGESVALLRRDNDFLNALAGELTQTAVEEGGQIRLKAACLAEAPYPVASRAAKALLVRASGEHAFRQAHIRAVLDTAASADPSAHADLPYGLRVRREYGWLCLDKGEPLSMLSETPLPPGHTTVGEWDIFAAEEGFTLRARQTGDELRLPKQRRKSLKKLLVEKKIPRESRDSLPVVADRDGVAAVAGLGSNTDHPRAGAVVIKKKERDEHEKRY